MDTVITSLARRGWLAPMATMGRLLPGYLRVAFLGAGLRSGILRRLAQGPATPEELAADLGYRPAMVEGLRSWLDLGVSLRELAERDGRYRLRGRRARTLLRPRNDPIAAFFEEFVELDHRLVLETPERLARGDWFELSDADPEVIARSSRMGEPWLELAIRQAVPAQGPVRLLEVGCGSGAHIRTAAGLNPQLTAVGLELQEPAARQARENLASWGLADRVVVETGDVRERIGTQDFDLVTLHQNIYYFPEAERVEVLRHLAGFLRPGGRLLVTTIVRGAGAGTACLDLWGAMTRGASRLPRPQDLVQALQQAGLLDVACHRLGPDGMYHAATGTRPVG